MLGKIEGRRRRWQRMRRLGSITNWILSKLWEVDREGQGSQACCSLWGLRVRHDWDTEQQQQQWTAFIFSWFFTKVFVSYSWDDRGLLSQSPKDLSWWTLHLDMCFHHHKGRKRGWGDLCTLSWRLLLGSDTCPDVYVSLMEASNLARSNFRHRVKIVFLWV